VLARLTIEEREELVDTQDHNHGLSGELISFLCKEDGGMVRGVVVLVALFWHCFLSCH